MLQPCTLQEFMDYMVYVTHDAENLQFYLWLVDYHQRFVNAPKTETDLSPRWNVDDPPAALNNVGLRTSDKSMASFGVKDIDMSSDDIPSAGGSDDASTYKETLSSLKFSEVVVNDANSTAGLKWQAFTVQPFRAEINRIITHYIAPGGPRELNLSHKDRAAVLHALQHTTHPSAFSLVKKMIDLTLRNHSHPNFIRWSICNGNRPRTIFLHCVATTCIVGSFILATLLTLSSASRWFRIFAAPAWWFGTLTAVASAKGFCVILHRKHVRNIRPWEISDEEMRSATSFDTEDSLRLGSNISYEDTSPRWPAKMEVFGSSNQFLGEGWIEKYETKPLRKKIADKKIRVRDVGMKIIQTQIVHQAHAWALLITVSLTVFFVALPKGNLF